MGDSLYEIYKVDIENNPAGALEALHNRFGPQQPNERLSQEALSRSNSRRATRIMVKALTNNHLLSSLHGGICVSCPSLITLPQATTVDLWGKERLRGTCTRHFKHAKLVSILFQQKLIKARTVVYLKWLQSAILFALKYSPFLNRIETQVYARNVQLNEMYSLCVQKFCIYLLDSRFCVLWCFMVVCEYHLR
jgi:hypothetical protein